MTVAGLIFSNIHDSKMPELTSRRTLASVPFGCRYRLIDFPLSNMVNGGITKIGVITHNNYRSLVDHIGTGKDWDLARRAGGIKILPPFITAYDSAIKRNLYSNRLEALIGVTNFIMGCSEDAILLCDCDSICNIDVKALVRAHRESGAQMTLVSVHKNFDDAESREGVYAVSADENGDVRSLGRIQPDDREGTIYANITIIDRQFLLDAINEAAHKGYNDFYRDIIEKNIGRTKIKNYLYNGVYIPVSSLRSYFSSSMRLLLPEVREDLLGVRERPIYTKVRNTAPSVYSERADVKNSYIADGCKIEGRVENSILFRGVHIGKGSVVKNSVLFQDTRVGEKVSLNCVVSDKDVIIRSGRVLSGHESIPFFLSKGTTV